MKKPRLDEELVTQGFFATSDEARRAVMAGEVSGESERFTSPGQRVKPGIFLHVKGRKQFVSRGGLKLQGGLDTFNLDPAGLRCLDIGCSTGGFTDCLLGRGAAHVTAVDVGYAQFDWSLRNNPSVELHERTNIVDLATQDQINTYDLAVCDVSFTSIENILDAVIELLVPGGRFLTLVKPQFEASRDKVGKGGIVDDVKVRLEVLCDVANLFAEKGFICQGACVSPIHGAKGNVEYLLLGQLTNEPQDMCLDIEGVCIDELPSRLV